MTVNSVPLLDLRRQGPELDAVMEEAFRRVLRSGHYVLGPEVAALEQECATYLGVKHALGVSSGTDALVLALMALGIGAGDEVVCPTYTFFATAGAIWRVGARPVFCEIHPGCYNTNADLVAKVLTPRTKAIVPVHLFGQCAEMAGLVSLAKERGIPLIEDAAQALGSKYRGESAGTFGSYGCFSFFPSKNLGALGDAGLVTTNDDALAERAKIFRAHGGKPKYYHSVVGGNFRIDALQAALIRAKLPHLDAWTAKRQQNAALYDRLFVESGVASATPACATACGASCPVSAGAPSRGDGLIQLPLVCQSRHIYNQYVIRIPGEGRRDRMIGHLKERRVGVEVYYPVPMHLQKCFASLGYSEGQFPESERAARETLAIPIFPELTEEEISYVVDSVVSGAI